MLLPSRLALPSLLVFLPASLLSSHAAPRPAAAAALSQEQAPAEAKPMELDYAVTIEPGEVPRLRCQLTLWNLTGPTVLALPRGTTFVRLEEPLLEGEVTARSTLLRPVPVERLDPYSWRIEPVDQGEVELAWTVPMTHREVPAIAERDAYEFPYVAEDHAMLTTAHFLLAPVLERSSPSTVAAARVRLIGPSGWAFTAPWEELRPNLFQPPDLDALRDEILLAGNWTVDGFVHDGVTITAAFAPGQERLAAPVAERIGKLVPAELELFEVVPLEQYLFAFGRPDMRQGLAGSPKSNSMTLAVADDLPAEVAARELSHLIAHEFFHLWQRARCAATDELRFVVEGFTDYMAYRTAARTGLLDAEGLRAALERELATAETSWRAFGGSLVEAGGAAFLGGGDAYDTTYAGGLVLALALDLALQGEGNALEDVLRALWNDPRWDEAGARTEQASGPGLAELRAAIEAVGAPELAGLAERVARHAGPPDLVKLFERVGVTLARSGTDQAPRYTLPADAIERVGGAGR